MTGLHFLVHLRILPGSWYDGNTDRLRTGKRILELQCSLGLISVADTSHYHRTEDEDPYGRRPFRHPAIESVECLLGGSHHWFTSHKQLANLAEQYGLPEVVRWHPRDVGGLALIPHSLLVANSVIARTSPSVRLRTRLRTSNSCNNRGAVSRAGWRSCKPNSEGQGSSVFGTQEELETKAGDCMTCTTIITHLKVKEVQPRSRLRNPCIIKSCTAR